jgi:hypothetical protein
MAFDIQARIAAAEKARDDAKAALSKEDLEEIAGRERLAVIDAERIQAEQEARELSLSRREDNARAKLGDVPMRAIQLKDLPDSFIIVDPGAHAYRSFQGRINALVRANKDTLDAHIDYAALAIHDWNGLTDWNAVDESGKAAGARLRAMLKAHPAVASMLGHQAGELAGLAIDERKKSR